MIPAETQGSPQDLIELAVQIEAELASRAPEVFLVQDLSGGRVRLSAPFGVAPERKAAVEALMEEFKQRFSRTQIAFKTPNFNPSM